MTQRWNGIPANPDQSGWHWVGHEDWLEPRYWSKGGHWRGCRPGQRPEWLTDCVSYWGPCEPPKARQEPAECDGAESDTKTPERNRGRSEVRKSTILKNEVPVLAQTSDEWKRWRELADLPLTRRAKNALADFGITTIDGLMQQRHALHRIPNLGPKNIREIDLWCESRKKTQTRASHEESPSGATHEMGWRDLTV